MALGLGTAAYAGTKTAAPVSPRDNQGASPLPSGYANFLVGRFAMTQGDVATAARALNQAANRDPSNAELREKAFLVTILNGDVDSAARMTGQLKTAAPSTQLMAELLNTVVAIKAGKSAEAQKRLEALFKIRPDDRSGILLKPYILAMRGQWALALSDAPDPSLGTTDRDRLLVYLVKAERARLNEIKGRIKDADALYTELYQPGAASFIFGPDYAAFLERQGRLDEARIVWTSMAGQNGDAASAEALRRLGAAGYKAPALPDLKQSMAQSLFVAATLAYSERNTEDALACLRLSLYLDSTSDTARIFLGQVEQGVRDTAAADAAWATIPTSSVQYSSATLRRIWSLRTQGRLEDANALADEGLKNRPDDLGLVVEKANILHEKNEDEAALSVFTDRIKRAGDSDFTWQAWFLQAVLYDSLDRWPEAEAAIKKAQALNDSRPEILNFVGYGLINRAIDIPAGMDMIREALKASPRSGAIIDSLGWGYYKLGQYQEALSYIEQAVQMDPSDPEVNDHLGDVYKAMGRDVEAGYEWQRVLSLKISDKQAVAIRKKLDENTADLAKIASQLKAQNLAATAPVAGSTSAKVKDKNAVTAHD